MQSDQSESWLDSLKIIPGRGETGKWSPKSVKTAACQQVVRLGRDVNLWDLPVPRSWPDELYPVVTSGQLTVRDPVTGRSHFFAAPLVVTGQQELAWYDENHLQSAIARTSLESKQNVPVAISLGGDPILSLVTALTGVADPRSFAGMLRGSSLEIVRCRTNDLDVPAGAEIIIEGYIDATNPRSVPTLSVARGNGRYVQRELPLIQVTALTHRANPIFPAIIQAPPPSEESWITLAAERISLPILKRLVPEIVDIHQPFCSAGRNLLFVSIRKTVNHQARRVLHALWGMEGIGQTKMIIIVDADRDVHSEEQIWFTVGTHACPNRDFLFSDGLGRIDDYTPLSRSLAGRVGIDATRKQHDESSSTWPQSLTMSDDILARVRERWSEYGMKDEG